MRHPQGHLCSSRVRGIDMHGVGTPHEAVHSSDDGHGKHGHLDGYHGETLGELTNKNPPKPSIKHEKWWEKTNWFKMIPPIMDYEIRICCRICMIRTLLIWLVNTKVICIQRDISTYQSTSKSFFWFQSICLNIDCLKNIGFKQEYLSWCTTSSIAKAQILSKKQITTSNDTSYWDVLPVLSNWVSFHPL